ncbi:hypothetical protein ACN47E_004291 [Coniothyrium glycines]
MAARHAVAVLLTIVATANSLVTPSASAFWTVTSRYVESVTESPYTRYDGVVTTYADTTYRTIKSTVTPTATPTSTSFAGHYYYDDVDTIYAFYPSSAVADTDLAPEYDYASATASTTSSAYTYMYFSMPVTMTAPASCPTPFTVTTSASVDVPQAVTHLVTPTSTDVSTSTDRYGEQSYEATWYLSAGAAPWTSTSDYYYNAYVASCSTPPAYYTGSRSGGSGSNSGSGGSSDSSSSDDYCRYYSYYGCRTPLLVWIIIIATVIPGLFLLGFLESWFWFRRLMMGKSAMRCGTICWVLISLWVLCFMRVQDRRSVEDQKVLTEKWKNMKAGAAFKAWLKVGIFCRRYPEQYLGQFSRQTVGIVPTGQPLHPAMAQAPPPPPGVPHGAVMYYGPPPPGWVPGPNGVYVPPQGYGHPSGQQAGYYGDAIKAGSTVSSSPVSSMGPQINAPSMYPQPPQPVHTPPQQSTMPSTAPQGSVPNPPSAAQAHQAPQLPPVSVSEVPADGGAPQGSKTGAPPHKNDPNDRSLYE